MTDAPDNGEARRNREANHPETLRTDAAEQPQPDPQTDPAGEFRATLGPLGSYFKRRAEFFEQEATLMAITLERMAQAQRKE